MKQAAPRDKSSTVSTSAPRACALALALALSAPGFAQSAPAGAASAATPTTSTAATASAPAAAVSVSASITPPKIPNSVRIGLIGPFSGGSSDFGTPMANGIRLAVDEINAVGGYLSRPVELVVADDKGDPATGRALSEELVKLGVTATLGFCNTGVALASLEVYQNAKMPLIVPCSTGTPLTAKYPARDSYIFRISAKDAIQAPFVVEDIIKRGWNRVAILHDSTGYGKAGRDDVIKALQAKNLAPVFQAQFDLKVQDLTEQLKGARAAGANVIFAYTVGPENAVLAKSKKALGWKVPHVGAWPLTFPNFIAGAGDASEGALMSTTFIAEPNNERRAAFLSAYARKYGVTRVPSPMSAAQGYDSVYLLMYAMYSIKDGSVTGPKLKQALEYLPRSYYGVVATYAQPFTLDDKDAVVPSMLVMGMVKNGAVTYAYPEDSKKAAVVKRKN